MKEKCKEDLPQFVDIEGFTGVALGDTHNFAFKEKFVAELQVIKCEDCGRESISWERVHTPKENQTWQEINAQKLPDNL